MTQQCWRSTGRWRCFWGWRNRGSVRRPKPSPPPPRSGILPRMDAADLRIFEAVARLGGMGRAAEALHTVQSNVTARIRQLEQELGTKLFRRHARGVEPTAAGRRLLPYAQRVARLLEDAR